MQTPLTGTQSMRGPKKVSILMGCPGGGVELGESGIEAES